MVPFAMLADLRYEETTEMKGGMMETLGKFAGMFGKKGLTKNTTSTYIKGDRLRKDQLTGDEPTTSQIIQLDRDQILTLDHKKKTYSVMTFAEMRAQMEKAIAAAKSQPKQDQPAPSPDKKPDVKVEPKVNVKDTGETKVINGFNTHRVLLTVELEGEDQKTKDKGAMGADTELWITKDISGFDEQHKFYQKYAKKMASPELIKSLDMSPGMRQDPRMAESAQAMRKKMESMEGVAILTIMSFNLSGTPSEETKTQANSQANSHPQKKSSEERKPENMSEAIGKALGGFGGFGRKKKKEDPPPEPAQTAPSTTTTSDGKVTATLMTSTTEMKSFSKTALDAGLFDVPAGYKLKVKD
jgi:hypothetical protein